jgi:mRNA-degrading endonuclease YafQ of YafQ-DinJ toxin-antitoxin module
MFWVSLDKTYKEYKKKVEADKKLLIEVILCLMRNKKILQQIKDYAAKKV